MPRRILPVLLFAAAATGIISAPAAASGLAREPFPIGTCADLPPVSPEPTCVIVDPTP